MLAVSAQGAAALHTVGNGECPSLGNDTEEFEYMAGTLTSIQALLSDIQASSSVGVPQDVAARAGRATTCMDNEKWWGVPNALQAVVWLSVPGTMPEGKDPWAQLKEAADYGETKGMPMAAMLAKQMRGYLRSRTSGGGLALLGPHQQRAINPRACRLF